MIRKSRFLLMLALFSLILVLPALARDYESIIAGSMKNTLVNKGVQPARAVRLAQDNLFIGTTMLRNMNDPEQSEEKIVAQSRLVGESLGSAMGTGFVHYGEKSAPAIGAAMMVATRAGIPVDLAASTFVSVVESGYKLETSIGVLHDIADAMRMTPFRDSGASLCKKIQQLASKKAAQNEFKKSIASAFDAERKQDALAKQQNSGGGGGGTSTASSGGQGGSGGGISSGSSSSSGSHGGGKSDSSGGSSDGGKE